MSLEPSFHSLRDALDPDNGAKARVFARLENNLRTAETLKQTATALTPTKSQQSLVWARISSRLETRAVSLLSRLRDLLAVNEPAHAFATVRQRLEQRSLQTSVWGHTIRWTTAAAVFVILVRFSPL